MRVGYTIVSLYQPSQEAEFARFLKDTLILEEGYADNIARVVAEGGVVNIFTPRDLHVALSGSSSYQFKTTFQSIETTDNQYVVASAVDFRLEVPFQGTIKVLAPTEYFITTESLARTLMSEVEQGLLKVYPSFPDTEGADWILDGGSWNDSGVWMDEKEWKDQ